MCTLLVNRQRESRQDVVATSGRSSRESSGLAKCGEHRCSHNRAEISAPKLYPFKLLFTPRLKSTIDVVKKCCFSVVFSAAEFFDHTASRKWRISTATWPSVPDCSRGTFYSTPQPVP